MEKSGKNPTILDQKGSKSGRFRSKIVYLFELFSKKT
jgi:hypothetical protein